MMGSLAGRGGAMALSGKPCASEEAPGARFMDDGLICRWRYGVTTEPTGGEGGHAPAR